MLCKIKEHMDLSPYIQVYGNCFGSHRYFIAVHFKKPVIRCSTNKIPVEIPNKSIVVSHKATAEECLMFTHPPDKSIGIPVADKKNHTLLLALFKPHSLLHSVYASETLFVVATQNPFQSIWFLCPKNAAFRALRKIFTQTHWTWEDLAELRHFHRNSVQWKRFNSWFHLAESFFQLPFREKFLTYIRPSAQLGKRIHGILRRSTRVVPSLPADFYQCQIMLTDSKPVGILCKFLPNQELEYISPMVVSEMDWDMKDVNGKTCTHWFPFYKDATTWKQEGLHFYCKRLYDSLIQMAKIRKWLQSQTFERYKHIYRDMHQVAYILLGE